MNVIITGFFIIMLSVPFARNNNLMNIEKEEITHFVDESAVFSYIDIFQTYYKNAKNNSGDRIADYSFEQFQADYYRSNMRINEFTDSFRNTQFVDRLMNGEEQFASQSAARSASTPDAWIYYYDPDNGEPVSPYFSRTPVYNYENIIYYDLLSVGDYTYESRSDTTNAPIVGHSALISDLSACLNNVYYIQTIEAMPVFGIFQGAHGVGYGFLDDERIVQYGIMFYRVTNATTQQTIGAVSFAESRFDDNYDIGHINTVRNSTALYLSGWYCSELVWASYYNVGINLDGYDFINDPAVTPYDLSQSSLVSSVVVTTCHLRMTVNYKMFNTWNITLYNPNDNLVYAQYNTKLCFDGDAATWNTSALTDITTVSIYARSSVNINISENWFATTAACSWKKNIYMLGFGTYSVRHVTYANELSSFPLSLNERFSIVTSFVEE